MLPTSSDPKRTYKQYTHVHIPMYNFVFALSWKKYFGSQTVKKKKKKKKISGFLSEENLEEKKASPPPTPTAPPHTLPENQMLGP